MLIGTVVDEFEEPIRKLKNSRDYHTDKQGYIITPIGKVAIIINSE